MKNDHRSKFSNLSNWKEEAWKHRGLNRIPLNPSFFQASSFQLLKMEDLQRWSFFTLKFFISLPPPKSQSTFIALFAYLSFALSSLSLPKMRGLILRRKSGTVSVEVFTFHVQLAFEWHTGTERTCALLSCSVYFVRIPLPFELIFLQQCNKIYRLTSKRLYFTTLPTHDRLASHPIQYNTIRLYFTTLPTHNKS